MPRYRIISCETLAREMRRALAALGRPPTDLLLLEGECHRPGVLPPLPLEALSRELKDCDGAVAACLMCFRPPGPHELDQAGITKVEYQSQAGLLLDEDAVLHALGGRAFLALPGPTRRWREVILSSWGLDQPTARQFFRESHDKILYLDTGLHADGEQCAVAMAEFVGLPLEVRRVGVGHLITILRHALERREDQDARRALERDLQQARASAADQAILADFVTSLGHWREEGELVRAAQETAEILFAPSALEWTPHEGPSGEEPGPSPGALASAQGCTASPLDDGASFVVRVRHQGTDLGTLMVRGVGVPQHLLRYLFTATALCEALALSLVTVRALNRERKMAASLAEKVVELDAFVYIASHDLKEPLRVMRSFAQLLDQRYASTLGDKGKLYIEQISEGGQRMEALIEDLLFLSRVGRKQVPPMRVALADVMRRVERTLAMALEQRGAELRVGSLPEVVAVPQWVERVLQNLVGNALKYNDKEKPVIEVASDGVEPDGAGRTLARLLVRDNGPGIPERFHARVFGLFQRLAPRDEPGSTGAGLAIVKRVVEQEGGRVWLQSAPGEGSTFYFTLPLGSGTK